MKRTAARAALAAGLLTATLAPPLASPATASGSSGNVVVVVPNTVQVLTTGSWCGGVSTARHQINGAHDAAAPTVYVFRTRRTLACFF